ncbi:MAG TPA: SbmA/BacA-like family transporter, partial [Devosia sp.]|nr:SbmA/BacA-like family transporter [Devosia sp.]
MLATVLIWFTVGEPIRSAIGLDRFTHPAVVVSEQVSGQPATADGAPAPQPAASAEQTNPNAPATTESASPSQQAAAAGAAESSVGNFLNADRIWLYQFVLMTAVLFCVFWYFYKRNEWYWWSVVGSTGILLVIYFQVQVEAFVNEWSGVFFDMIQLALTQPRSVEPSRFYGEVFTLFVVLMPTILVAVLLAFFTSHYVFRWRKAMNFYYMAYWPAIRQTEGAAQRVQEDTMRFASIVEDLGTAFFGSLITLVVFLPILWGLSSTITELPIFGNVPGSLVWVALAAAIFGTILLAVVGVKLPGLNFANQRVEAAYRKELVFGEDHAERAGPPT